MHGTAFNLVLESAEAQRQPGAEGVPSRFLCIGCGASSGAAHLKKGIAEVVKVQKRISNLIRGLEHLPYEATLKHFRLFRLGGKD